MGKFGKNRENLGNLRKFGKFGSNLGNLGAIWENLRNLGLQNIFFFNVLPLE
jgi:hypothetical protein